MRLWLVQYEHEETGEVEACMVVAPNEKLAARFCAPHEVLQVAYIDDTGVAGAGNDSGGSDRGNSGAGGAAGLE